MIMQGSGVKMLCVWSQMILTPLVLHFLPMLKKRNKVPSILCSWIQDTVQGALDKFPITRSLDI